MKQRVPRDIGRYCSTAEAAAQIRNFADNLEQRATPGELVKWSMSVRHFTPEPEPGCLCDSAGWRHCQIHQDDGRDPAPPASVAEQAQHKPREEGR